MSHRLESTVCISGKKKQEDSAVIGFSVRCRKNAFGNWPLGWEESILGESLAGENNSDKSNSHTLSSTSTLPILCLSHFLQHGLLGERNSLLHYGLHIVGMDWSFYIKISAPTTISMSLNLCSKPFPTPPAIALPPSPNLLPSISPFFSLTQLLQHLLNHPPLSPSPHFSSTA